MAGLYGKCSHVAAILFKVAAAVKSGHCGTTCTDLPCSWNVGTKRNIAPVPIQNLKFKKPKVNQTVAEVPESDNQVTNCRVPSFTTNEEYSPAIANSGLLQLFLLPGTLLNETFSKTEPQNFHSLCVENHCYSCLKFFNSFIDIDESKMADIALLTMEQ